MYYNKTILAGFLVRDPELRYLPSGTAVGTFTLAVQDRYGEKKDTCFIDVTTFGKLAENVCKFTKKGSNVLVDGRLQLQMWESKGQKRQKHQVIAMSVIFITRTTEEVNVPNATVPNTTVPPVLTDDDVDLEPF
jgi:single-strand DNA-binding protein